MKTLINFLGWIIVIPFSIIFGCIFIATVLVLSFLGLPSFILAAPVVIWYGTTTQYKDWPKWAKIIAEPFHIYHRFMCLLLFTKQNLNCYG